MHPGWLIHSPHPGCFNFRASRALCYLESCALSLAWDRLVGLGGRKASLSSSPLAGRDERGKCGRMYP